jgi:hypothetical protein
MTELTWFQKNKEHLKTYKREYYQNHPEYRQRKKELALARYYKLKEEKMKTDRPASK